MSMDRNPGRIVVALFQGTVVLGMAMIALLWGSITVFLSFERQKAIDSAMMNTANLARAFGEHTARTIFGEDSTLVVLRAMLQRDPSSFALIDWGNFAAFDGVLQYSLIDRDGKLAASSLGTDPNVPLNDREHFLHHAGSSEDTLYIGKPVSSGPSHKPAIQLSRKLNGPAGEFSGVIVSSLDQRKLTEFYEGIQVGKDGAISLIGLDGNVLAARGFKKDITFVPKDSAMQRRVRSNPEGSYITSGSFDGVARILSYRKVDNLPLIVTAGVSKAETLASHDSDALKARIIGGGITAMIIVVMGFSVANRMRLDRANEALRASEPAARATSEQLRTTLENIDQGIIMVGPDGFIQVINQRAAQLLEIPDDWLSRRLKFRELGALLWDRGEFEGAPLPHIRKMLTDDSRYLGPVVFERTRPNGTVLEVRNVLLPNGGLLRTLTDVTARRQAEERLRHLALHDDLTGLANRAAFKERIEHCFQRAQRHGECFALLTFDMDRFKEINDRLGHLAGDGVLREAAQRLKACVRDSDLAARLGGDEFAVVQANIRSTDEVTQLAQRVLNAMRAPFRIGGDVRTVGISMGIAIAPRHASKFKDLTAAADAALYKAKRDGGDRFVFHAMTALRPVA
jgi:diguanylate cyclase (GGDEF)-like protein